jgi:hypothetical protein
MFHLKLQAFKSSFDYPIQKGDFGQQDSWSTMKNISGWPMPGQIIQE